MTVYLVGAGPGDPGLLTVRGAEVLSTADVVVYDRLSIASLLEVAPAAAERIPVGKTPRGPSTPQEDINALLVERGRLGQTVVRLKGGDPFVFARGGEEAAALAAAGVPFEIVPGITSAIAAPAYAGVPVTHRGMSTSFTVVTGHEDPWSATETDWDAVARVGGTIVVLMGVATRAEIAARLMAGGLAGSTPVMAVSWGTRPEQRSLRTTLAGLGAADVGVTSAIVIGEVASLDLGWFESRPLFGRSVVVGRTPAQASTLSARLRALGAEVIEVPLISISPGDAVTAEHLSSAAWIALTSVNAVEALFTSPDVRDARSLAGVSIAAVGPGTAAALAARGVVADLVASPSSAEGLVAAFPAAPTVPPGAASTAPAGSGSERLPGRTTVLLPQSSIARAVLADGLRAKGWPVDVVVAYRTVPADIADADAARIAGADAIALTSSSTARSAVEALGVRHLPATVVSIGPATTEAAKSLGVGVTRTADRHDLDGLVDAVVLALGPASPSLAPSTSSLGSSSARPASSPSLGSSSPGSASTSPAPPASSSSLGSSPPTAAPPASSPS